MCVLVGGGALSVVKDGHKPTLKLSAMTSDMTSLVSACDQFLNSLVLCYTQHVAAIHVDCVSVLHTETH